MTLTVEPRRPVCGECNIRAAKKGPKSVHGYQTWANLCGSCDSKKYRKPRIVDLICSVCGFNADDECQIDSVDSKSICSNCNRLRVKQSKQKKHDEYQITVDATVNWLDIRL
jgi:hypothetical protein